MPWLPITLKTLKPKETELDPRTLEEHIKRCRLIRGLTQNEAAKVLGVSPATVVNWETGNIEPSIKSTCAILRWLGYDPYPEPRTLPERMLAKRRGTGWSVNDAARRLGVDAGTWAAWERGVRIPKGRHLRPLLRFLSQACQDIL